MLPDYFRSGISFNTLGPCVPRHDISGDFSPTMTVVPEAHDLVMKEKCAANGAPHEVYQ
jgi:hypothetical protein